MKYGYFDNDRREYVIDRVNTPFPWTNYIGVNDMCTVLSQAGGGYTFYKSPQNHRVTRFRPNAPIDMPGHFVYIRDDDTGEFWSVSWQPVAKPLDKAKYVCRHGLSYTKFESDYKGIEASQTIFIPLGEPIELWDVALKNKSDKTRKLSVYSYLEFSYHFIDMDNQNFQMSLYSAGSSYHDGVIQLELFYEPGAFQWFASDFRPDGFDCLRDQFLGFYHDERSPAALEKGECAGSFEKGGNHCAVLRKNLEIQPGKDIRLCFMLGEGRAEEAAPYREKYSNHENIDKAFADLAAFWDKKCSKLQVNTPSEGLNTSLNIWNLYQAEVNIMFSRFASFIEVGGRTGLGYRDTSQDAMTVIHSNPQKCRQRIIELLRGLTSMGYGLHLFQPEWFDPEEKKDEGFKSPTIVPDTRSNSNIHGVNDACSDDALWLVSTVAEFIRETGEVSLLDEIVTYADGGKGTVYEHLTKILDFSAEQVGETGICKGLRADWNDCLNLGGGESAMVSFLHYWAIQNFLGIARFTGHESDAAKYEAIAEKVKKACEDNLWDGEWYIRGITASGRKIGTKADAEGKIHLESNAWAVLSGVAEGERALAAMDSIDKYLYTPYGIVLNAPSYTVPDDEIGFVTKVYPGIKENGAIFSHPNPWVWCAEAKLGGGDRLMRFYDALLPYNQNDIIETRRAEPYSYCQFIMGPEHTAFGRANHPFMTGSGGWAYFAASHYIVGVRPDFDRLVIDPCIPSDWDGFTASREWRGALYNITVENPQHVCKGVAGLYLDGEKTDKIGVQEPGTVHEIKIIMG
ncbi:MAG: N,N'-diacetylchitobiose phosphorylase [Oscillospiraceae bacterium]|jgi:N,N'-diacetylchitobiose phosphorylase|nr:N,N'-diacetylchitobiose phosphorylase [Oscillospiraceae bacterium]